MKEIPKKNYIVLCMIVVITLLLAIYFRNYYLNHQKQKDGLQINNISEIDEKSLSNYIVENDEFILYVTNREESNLNSFEKKLGNYLTKKEYNKNIIYLDLTSVSNSFYKDFRNQYFDKKLQKKKFLKQTNLFYFEDDKVVDMLYSDKTEKDIDDFKKFIDDHNNVEN